METNWNKKIMHFFILLVNAIDTLSFDEEVKHQIRKCLLMTYCIKCLSVFYLRN